MNNGLKQPSFCYKILKEVSFILLLLPVRGISLSFAQTHRLKLQWPSHVSYKPGTSSTFSAVVMKGPGTEFLPLPCQVASFKLQPLQQTEIQYFSFQLLFIGSCFLLNYRTELGL